MNWDQVKGEWKQLKGSARKQWGKITDDEFEQAAGDRERFEGIIQERYGRTKEEVSREVDDWMRQN